jgi:hypothetical protein
MRTTLIPRARNQVQLNISDSLLVNSLLVCILKYLVSFTYNYTELRHQGAAAAGPSSNLFRSNMSSASEPEVRASAMFLERRSKVATHHQLLAHLFVAVVMHTYRMYPQMGDGIDR